MLQVPLEVRERFRTMLAETPKWRAARAAVVPERSCRCGSPQRMGFSRACRWPDMGLTFGPPADGLVPPVMATGVSILAVEPWRTRCWFIEPGDTVIAISDFKPTSLPDSRQSLKRFPKAPVVCVTRSPSLNPVASQKYILAAPEFCVHGGEREGARSNLNTCCHKAAKRGPFPWLKEQKLADIVWKRLELYNWSH